MKGLNGLYQISNLGNIKTLKRKVFNGNGDRQIQEKILKLRKWKNKYYQAKLSKNGKIYTFYVHRLVANAFIPNLDKKIYINHKDNNGFNNVVDNLEWVTQKENVENAWKNGFCENVRKKAKLSKGRKCKRIIQINNTGNIVETYLDVKDVMSKLNITEAQVRNSIRRKSKKYNLRWESEFYANC